MKNIPLTSIWERYILKSLFKMFFLCLFGFYGLYVLINYSSHSSSFHQYNLTFLNIIQYYLYDFITRVDFLVPFALLIASTYTLCSLNSNNELTALLMGGVTHKRILFPFFLVAFLLMGLLYLNEQVAAPLSAQHYRQYQQVRARDKHSKRNHPHIQQIPLSDKTSIIFRNFNNFTKEFEDAYWVRSINDIVRFQALKPTDSAPIGTNVQYLQRNEAGNLVITESYDEKAIPEIQFFKDSLLETITDPDGYSLSTLYEKSQDGDPFTSEKDARILTSFYRKLAMPLACLLAVMIAAPICHQFTRTLPTFFIYATNIFALVVFFLVMNASSHLGERQVISPALAIWIPTVVFLSLAMIRAFFEARRLR